MKKSVLLLSCCFLTATLFAQQPIQGGPFISTSFVPKLADSVGVYPHFVVFGDFNSDGKPDLVVARGSSSAISVMTNTSTSGSVTFGAQLNLTASGSSHEVAAVGDLDGDGKTDILAGNWGGANSVSVFRNTTTGSSIRFAAKQDL